MQWDGGIEYNNYRVQGKNPRILLTEIERYEVIWEGDSEKLTGLGLRFLPFFPLKKPVLGAL